MSQTPNYYLIYCPSDNLEKYNVTCILKYFLRSSVFLYQVELNIRYFFFFTTGITLILFPSILSDEMDGRKTEAIIVQMQLVSVCGLPICVNAQLFYIWSHNIRKLLNNSFYEYGQLNCEYKEKQIYYFISAKIGYIADPFLQTNFDCKLKYFQQIFLIQPIISIRHILAM